MEQKKFEALLILIVPRVIGLIAQNCGMDEITAASSFYASRVYSLLETEETKLKKITLMPVEMKMDGHRSEQGLPRKCDSEKIFDYLNDMCKPYGTTIVREENGLLSCVW